MHATLHAHHQAVQILLDHNARDMFMSAAQDFTNSDGGNQRNVGKSCTIYLPMC